MVVDQWSWHRGAMVVPFGSDDLTRRRQRQRTQHEGADAVGDERHGGIDSAPHRGEALCPVSFGNDAEATTSIGARGGGPCRRVGAAVVHTSSSLMIAVGGVRRGAHSIGLAVTGGACTEVHYCKYSAIDGARESVPILISATNDSTHVEAYDRSARLAGGVP